MTRVPRALPFDVDGVESVYVAASSRCFADLPFAQACQALADLGFDDLELCVSDDGHLPTKSVTESPEDFVNSYRDATRMTPVALTLLDDFSVDVFATVCRASKALRVATIVVSAAPHGTPFNEEIDRLRELTRVASETSVRVAVRTERNRMADEPQAAEELCRHVNGLGLSYDPSHFVVGGYHEPDSLFDHVFHVQLRDSTHEELQVPLGLGELDYARVAASLEKVGYRQALTVDLIPGQFEGETRFLELRKTRRLIDTLL